jgi:hypothetical protein
MTPLIRWTLTVLLSSLPLNLAVPQESEPLAEVWPGFTKTEKYIQLGANQQGIYAAGLVDGMYLTPVFDAPNKDKYLTAMRTCLKSMTNTQVAAVITKYAKDHPEKWNMGTNVVAWQALLEACSVR